jgi:hypothetical protein
MLRSMEKHVPSGAEGRAGSRRKLLILGVPVIALVVLAVLLQLRGGGDGPGSAATLAASSPGPDDAPRFEGAVEDRGDEAALAAPAEPQPADIAPQDAVPVIPQARPQDVRGVVVRASDLSPVFWATISARGVDRESGRETVLVRARSDATGSFALHSPHAIDGFEVTVPPPGATRDDRRPGKSVPVRVEWGSEDPLAPDVRLEVDTGWRLDLRVRDEAGQPRVGTVVSAAGLTATCDAEGQCVLLDLPAGPAEISLVVAPGVAAVTRRVEQPAAGQLRTDATVTLP